MLCIKGSVPIYAGVRESNRGRLLFWVFVRIYMIFQSILLFSYLVALTSIDASLHGQSLTQLIVSYKDCLCPSNLDL